MKRPDKNLPGQVIQMLEAIRADNRSGAAELLRKAADIYRSAASSNQAGLSPESLRLMVDSISSALGEAQPGMAGLLNMTREVDQTVRRSSSTRPLELAAQAASEFADSASRMTAASAALGAQLIAENAIVLTHSRSSTVLASLIAAASSGRSFSVIATESRPMLEGRPLAESISSAGIQVTLIVDAAAAHVMHKVDMVLVGADRVTPDHVLNKIGTRMIALAGWVTAIPVYCLTDTSKFIGEAPTTPEEAAHPGVEVWPDCPAGISIINPYFEEVPIDLFTGIVTETGLLEPVDAAKLAASSSPRPLSED